MKPANLILVTDQLTTENSSEALAHRSINTEAQEPISARKTRHLDVDAVLARSLPQVVCEQLPTRIRSKELKAA